jgi:glutamate racemase
MRKIGIIDSGIGGIALLTELAKLQDQFSFFYQSDHSNVPYGGKEQDFMLKQTSSMVEKLLVEQVELIIIACNTLTVETINTLRQRYTVDFVGIEPFINYINKELYLENEKVGIILTTATANSDRFKNLKSSLDPNDIIHIFPQPNLALIIEDSLTGSEFNLEVAVTKELKKVIKANLDVLILGCTHYPLITKIIKKVIPCKVIDPHKEVALRVLEKLRMTTLSKVNSNYLQVEIKYASEINSDWSLKSLSQFSFIKRQL